MQLGKTEGRRRRDDRMRRLEGITDLMDMSLSRLWEMKMDREAKYAAIHGFTKSWTGLTNTILLLLLLSHFSRVQLCATL